MIDRVKWQDCCLCKSCLDVCQVKAIRFEKEHYSFKYPTIDVEKCVKCNKCEEVCPVLVESNSISEEKPEAYGAQNVDSAIRNISTSGGVFFEIAKHIISIGGFVCGAVFDDKYRVKHIVSDNVETVMKMCGSKYSQSDFSSVFLQLQEIVSNNKPVFVCACPCQIAAIRKCLKTIPHNMFLAELVCHGVPSEQLLQNYIIYMEKKYNSKLADLRFRDKAFGWHMSSVRMKFENNRIYINPITVDAYMKGFLSGATLKESCYNCKFKGFSSGSDLVLGDFWGAEKEMPEMDDNSGISGVIVCTKKGKELLSRLNLSLFETKPDTIISHNKNIIQSTPRNSQRDEFFNLMKDKCFDVAIRTFFEEKKVDRVKRKIRYGVRSVYYKLTRKGKPLY